MKPEFAEFFESEIRPKCEPLEAVRRKHLKRFYVSLALAFALIPALVFLLVRNAAAHELSEAQANLTVFACLAIAFFVWSPVRAYREKAKTGHGVMESLVGFFGDFDYRFGSVVPAGAIERSKLFSDFERQEGDDFLTGEYKGFGITLSEEEHIIRVRTGKGGSRDATTFRGVIALIDMDRKFGGRTVVKADHGWLFNRVCGIGLGSRVALEDVEFEKRFEAFSDDQVEARYLLTTAFMERMLAAKKAFGGKKIEFSFFDNRLLIKIPTREDMFEASSLFCPAADYRRAERAFGQFASVFAIADILFKLRSAEDGR